MSVVSVYDYLNLFSSDFFAYSNLRTGAEVRDEQDQPGKRENGVGTIHDRSRTPREVGRSYLVFLPMSPSEQAHVCGHVPVAPGDKEEEYESSGQAGQGQCEMARWIGALEIDPKQTALDGERNRDNCPRERVLVGHQVTNVADPRVPLSSGLRVGSEGYLSL